jgi:hypothetical protein
LLTASGEEYWHLRVEALIRPLLDRLTVWRVGFRTDAADF